MPTKSGQLEEVLVIAKNKATFVILAILNVMLVIHLYFVSLSLAETTASLNASLGDLELWRRLASQSSNLSFFGSFFIFQAACYLVFFKPIFLFCRSLYFLNLLLTIFGAAVAIHGGLSWDLLFPGMA